MALENLDPLVTTVKTEVAYVQSAKEALSGVRGELDQAKAVVAEKQAAVDEASAVVSKATGEAVASLRAIQEEINAAIENLQGSAS